MVKLKYCWLGVVCFMFSCADSDPQVFQLNEPINVFASELVTLELPQQDEYIDLMVLEIEESRCPSNVNCIRFGEASVSVGLNGVEEIIQTLDLCIGDCPERGIGFIEVDTLQVELDDKAYAVILEGVTPYPTTDNGVVPKQAILKIIEW